jgi:hypothetical protein
LEFEGQKDVAGNLKLRLFFYYIPYFPIKFNDVLGALSSLLYTDIANLLVKLSASDQFS